MNAVSGISVVLYEPPADGRDTGRKFKGVLRDFYPWDVEPSGSINCASEGANVLYETFRNPLTHAFGFQAPEPPGRLSITRLGPSPLRDDELEALESSPVRPTSTALRGAGTLIRDKDTQALDLNAESLYWGVRELLRRLTADHARMELAEAFLRPMLRT
jgi:hypothetical protein